MSLLHWTYNDSVTLIQEDGRKRFVPFETQHHEEKCKNDINFFSPDGVEETAKALLTFPLAAG